MRTIMDVLRPGAITLGLVGVLAAPGGAQEPAYARQTSPGEVALEVQPRWESGALLFEITANTHTVALGDVDLLKSARLVVGADTLAPAAAGGFGGHHATVTVRFETPTRPEAFELEIRDVPDVPVRLLRWPAPGAGEGRS